jgi:16S rRNA (guanine527-N7)-methyltransferase
MTTAARLRARADALELQLTDPLAAQLVRYIDLLFRWNAKINLTSLTDPDAAVDRLLLEPLAAARHLSSGVELMDLGSGGGSPAIPLALALNASRLVMVESKSRKAAFLREAVRVLGLASVVENARFEDVAAQGRHNGQISLVSIRAVRVDLPTLTTAKAFLRAGGNIALFAPTAASPTELPADIRVARLIALPNCSHLVVLTR